MTDAKPGSGDKDPTIGIGCSYLLLGMTIFFTLSIAALIVMGRGENALGVIFKLIFVAMLFGPIVIVFLPIFVMSLVFDRLFPRKRSSGGAPDQPSRTAQRNPKPPGSFGSRQR